MSSSTIRRAVRGRSQRGQALVEYSMVAHVLLLGGLATAWPFMSTLMNALTLYYQSLYFVVASAAP